LDSRSGELLVVFGLNREGKAGPVSGRRAKQPVGRELVQAKSGRSTNGHFVLKPFNEAGNA